MRPRRPPFFLAAIAALAIFIYGCASRLEPGGHYAPLPVVVTNTAGVVVTNQVAPDFALFVSDSAFLLADQSFRTVSKWEQDNRLLLWRLDPTVKHRFDTVRPAAWKVEQDYVKARKAYLLNPTPANLTVLNDLISRLQRYLAAAQAVVPQLQTVKP